MSAAPPATIPLAAEEQELYARIDFDPPHLSPEFHETLNRSCEAAKLLALSLLKRDAIPAIRWACFADPAYNDREAKERIEAFHRTQRSGEWLRREARAISELGRQQSGSAARRLQQNAGAMLRYEQFCGAGQFTILAPVRFRLAFFGVSISVAPDLHVSDRGETKMIKIQFGGLEPKEQAVKVITQCLLHAANAAEHKLSGSSVIYMDLPRGVEHGAPRTGARILRDVEAACETISQIGGSIPPPRRKSKRSIAA